MIIIDAGNCVYIIYLFLYHFELAKLRSTEHFINEVLSILLSLYVNETCLIHVRSIFYDNITIVLLLFKYIYIYLIFMYYSLLIYIYIYIYIYIVKLLIY